LSLSVVDVEVGGGLTVLGEDDVAALAILDSSTKVCSVARVTSGISFALKVVLPIVTPSMMGDMMTVS
jgi:hypothetical protein